MAERATAAQTIQIGAESTSTPGTAVPAGKLIASLDLTGGIQAENDVFRPAGHKYAAFVVPGREWSQWKVGGKVTYGEVVYPLCSALVSATASADGSTAKKWVFAPALCAEDTVQTYSIEMGGTVRAHSFAHGIFTELGFKFSRKGVEYDGTLLGYRISDGITMTSTPAAIENPPVPIAGTQISITTATSWANLDGAPTTLERVLSAEWRIGDRHKPLWVLDASKTSFVTCVEGVPAMTAKFMMEADSAGMGFLTAMRTSGTQKWLRIKCEGAEIESGKKYLFQIDGCYNVKQVGEFKDEDGVYAVEWGLEPVYDATKGETYEFTVRNKVAAL